LLRFSRLCEEPTRFSHVCPVPGQAVSHYSKATPRVTRLRYRLRQSIPDGGKWRGICG